jgi:hypothetical protein
LLPRFWKNALCDCGTAGVASNAAGGVIINFRLMNDLRRGLGSLVGIFETAHLLRVADGAGSPICRLGGVDVPNILRQCVQQRAA